MQVETNTNGGRRVPKEPLLGIHSFLQTFIVFFYKQYREK